MPKKKITIKQIAELSGTAPSTVSRVLSGKECKIPVTQATRDKILSICNELDYHPSIHASRFFAKKSKVIGFVACHDNFKRTEDLSKLLFSLCRCLFAKGYRCLPLYYDSTFVESREYINIFKRNEIDGLFIWGARPEHSFHKELFDEEFPFVFLTNKIDEYPAVYTEQFQPVYKLTKACIDNGAKRICGVGSQHGFSFSQRHAGFAEALKTAPNVKSKHIELETEDFVEELTSRLSEITEFKPDAVVCANDLMAITVERHLQSLGLRIPEDVMICGGDNFTLSNYSNVSITTFDSMSEEIAEKATDMMVEHLTNKTPLTTIKIQPQIIWRDSLKPITK